MIRINLLPVRAAQKKERLINQLAILTLSIVVTVVLCSLTWVSLSGKIASVKTDIQAKNTEIASLKKKIGEVQNFKVLQQGLREKLDILETLKSNRTGPVRLLDELSKLIPEKVWITTFTETNGAISITGLGMTEESIASFLRNLEDSDYYMNVELDVIEQKKTANRDQLSFNLRCNVEKQKQSGSLAQKS